MSAGGDCAGLSGAVGAAVGHAWASVLGSGSCQADRRWDESAGDSLKAMELWFHIEQELGRKIALIPLDESTTPSSLAAAIERQLAGAARTRRTSTLFLMPGILGDEPLLAQFRAALGWNVRFEVIDYPAWHELGDTPLDFGAIVDAAFAQICAAPVCESYLLAGYSFGGYVAFEVARRLIASSRRVGFLGLIDSRLSSFGGDSRIQAWRTRFKRYGHLLAKPLPLARFVLRQLHQRCRSLLRLVALALVSRPSAAMLFELHRERNYRHRLNALQRWPLSPLDLPVTLFLSEHGLPDLPPDYGWKVLCRTLTIVHIGGTHTSMMESPQRELLCAHLLEAIQPAA